MKKQMQMVTDQLVGLCAEYAKALGTDLPIKFTANVEHDLKFGFMVHLSYAIDMPSVLTALHFVLDRDDQDITLEKWCMGCEADPNEIGPLVDQAVGLVPFHREAQDWIDLLFYLCGTQENDILPEYYFDDDGYYIITVTKDGINIEDGWAST